ncbi:MAG: hypothetical protein H0T42_28220 [Deltaproteobacteria bacterium]|nr:hypothetical protein [Deltaproteobacteria bacterium]
MSAASTDPPLDETLVVAKAIQDTITQALSELHLMSERAGAAGSAITHGIERSLLALLPAQRMAAEMADLAQLDARRLLLRREPAELGELLTETVDHCVLPHQRRAVQLDLRTTTKLRIDRERIQRVIASFLHSAITYGYPVSPIVIRLEEEDRRACVSISDVGPGLTATQSRAIFERRNPAAARTQPIGLYISRKIVEAHGGEVGIDSTPSVGATFWFALPVTP